MTYQNEKIFYNDREAEAFAKAHDGKIKWTRDEHGQYTYYVRYNEEQTNQKENKQMKKIEVLEAIRVGEVKATDAGIKSVIFWAYNSARANGNETLDFNETIWDEDVEAIVNFCKDNDISYFTISTTQSSLIEILAQFEKYGATMSGLTKVKTRFTNFITGDYDTVTAIKMSL